MAARVIHFGQDSCHRLSVLEKAGYSVDGCSSISQLSAALQSPDEPDAVVMTDDYSLVPEEAILLARSHSLAPIILFRSPDRSYVESNFDLVIPVLTPPACWLADIAAVIEQGHILREESAQLREESELLRQESAAVRQKSRNEQTRAKRERSRNADLVGWDSKKTDSTEKC
jgi:hypothetical protein